MDRARSGETPGEPGLRRVAVLPFENLGAPDQAYFADGLTDEIRSTLATISGLQVTARTSSTRYAQGTKPAQEIGRELGVDYLLTGTVPSRAGASAALPADRRGELEVAGSAERQVHVLNVMSS